MKTILVVEDEKKIRELLVDYLTESSYHVLEAEDGEEAMDIFNSTSVDLVVLDIMMPKMNGFEVCKEIRKKRDTLIIFLSAKSEETDKLIGFELGADEYITKPFSPKVLVARVNALFKVVHKSKTPVITKIGALAIDFDSYSVVVDEKEVSLTSKEFQLLSLLVENKGRVLKRNYLLDTIWGYDFFGTVRVLDTNVKTLRKKLGSCSGVIKTVIGVGYKLEG